MKEKATRRVQQEEPVTPHGLMGCEACLVWLHPSSFPLWSIWSVFHHKSSNAEIRTIRASSNPSWLILPGYEKHWVPAESHPYRDVITGWQLHKSIVFKVRVMDKSEVMRTEGRRAGKGNPHAQTGGSRHHVGIWSILLAACISGLKIAPGK
jgi:hypothetical protein